MPLVLSGTNGISTNGANWALQPDSSGRSFRPNQPNFRAYLASTQNYSAGAIVIFNATAHNVGSMYNTSNGRMTAPVAGYYLLSYQIVVNGGTNSFRGLDVTPYLNGSLVDGAMARDGGYSFTSGTYTGASNTIIMYLNANDYLEIRASTFDNAASTFFSDECTFCAYLLG